MLCEIQVGRKRQNVIKSGVLIMFGRWTLNSLDENPGKLADHMLDWSARQAASFEIL